MARDPLAEKAVIGVVHGDRVHPQFAWSLAQLEKYDELNGRRLTPGQSTITIRGTNLPDQRNKVVRAFLESTSADWLWFIDTDQDFEPDTLERLILAADPETRPIMSGLVFSLTTNRSLPITPAPVVYDPERERIVHSMTVPPERFWRVAGAGTGCLLIHRTVLERMGDSHSDDAFPWFKYAQHNQPDGTPDMMGEDFTFSMRAAALDVPIWVDTTIECGHYKETRIGSREFWAQLPPEMRPRKTWTVIPTISNTTGLRALIGELRRQGHGDGIVVCDNGVGKTQRNWLDSQPDLVVLDCHGDGIHEMWNKGAIVALSNSPAGCDIVYLNDDLTIGPDLLPKLVGALRGNPQLMVVSPNYDNRTSPGEDIQFVSSICANRYDGTGGIAGFAFAVKGELMQGWRFPEEYRWWFGDNELVMAVLMNGGLCGIVLDATVDHDRDGLSWDRPDHPRYDEVQADKQVWQERWAKPAESVGAGVFRRGSVGAHGAADGDA